MSTQVLSYSSPPFSHRRLSLPDLPEAKWSDFSKDHEGGMTLKAIAEKYMCDPRTVRIFLMLNKNSSEIILPAKEEFFEALENFRDPNKSIYRDEFEDFLNTTYGEMDEEEEEREPDW